MARLHVRARRLTEHEARTQPDRHHGVPLRLGDGERGLFLAALRRGAVHENRDRAQCLLGSGEQPGGGSRVGEIGRHEGRVKLARQCASCFDGNVAQHQANAFAGECLRDAAADSGRRAADQCRIAVEQSHRVLLALQAWQA
jgi:hypothetical protein